MCIFGRVRISLLIHCGTPILPAVGRRESSSQGLIVDRRRKPRSTALIESCCPSKNRCDVYYPSFAIFEFILGRHTTSLAALEVRCFASCNVILRNIAWGPYNSVRIRSASRPCRTQFCFRDRGKGQYLEYLS